MNEKSEKVCTLTNFFAIILFFLKAMNQMDHISSVILITVYKMIPKLIKLKWNSGRERHDQKNQEGLSRNKNPLYLLFFEMYREEFPQMRETKLSF